MPRKYTPRYSAEFKSKLVALVRAGREPRDLAKEFEPSAQSIREWVAQADRDDGIRQDGLTSTEREELNELRRENKRLKLEREILAKANGLVRTGDRPDAQRAFELMRAHQATFPIATMARVFGVSPSGYYAWRDREPSQHQLDDENLMERIEHYHRRSGGVYGAPRIHQDLVQEDGLAVSRKRVARLMRLMGLRGVSRRRGFKTTQRDVSARRAPDLVNRDFTADGPNQLWVADATYIRSAQGFFFLAVILDVWSRRVVGWALGDHLNTELMLSALDMAIERRNPKGVIHHSDQGCQYTSLAFGARCHEAGVIPSMGSVGDAYDNAMSESFFATLECELLMRNHFETRTQGKQSVFEFIEGFYNCRRRHSRIDYLSPVEYERRHSAAA
ncbi:MAG: IS3 family transposase [Myxococcota bacterium]